jgi:sec-independent protein translocase protein TatA
MGPQELIIVLIVVLLLFGGKKIPELMRGVGKGLGEFKSGVEDAKYTARKALEDAEVNHREEEDRRARAREDEERRARLSATSTPDTTAKIEDDRPISN